MLIFEKIRICVPAHVGFHKKKDLKVWSFKIFDVPLHRYPENNLFTLGN